MLNMLHGEFYKLKKSRSFYISILIAMGLILLLYATLHMVDNIHEEEQSGNTRIVVKGEEEVVLDEEGNVVPISQQVGIMGIVQQMFDSHFTEFIIAIFISIFVTAEFGNGAIKNEEITIEKINEWFDKNAKSLQRAKKINLNPILENARNNVINYYDYLNKGYSDKNRWTTIKASEMKVSLAMKDYIIKGTIDMVRDYPEFYRIFDFKTGQCEENMLQSYYRQLRIYAYLLGCITEEKEVTMQLFFTGEKGNHIRTLRYDNEKENITKEIEQFSNTVAKIMKHEFSKMCSNDKICSKCDFKYICKNIKQLEN